MWSRDPDAAQVERCRIGTAPPSEAYDEPALKLTVPPARRGGEDPVEVVGPFNRKSPIDRGAHAAADVQPPLESARPEGIQPSAAVDERQQRVPRIERVPDVRREMPGVHVRIPELAIETRDAEPKLPRPFGLERLDKRHVQRRPVRVRVSKRTMRPDDACVNAQGGRRKAGEFANDFWRDWTGARDRQIAGIRTWYQRREAHLHIQAGAR